MTHGRRYAYETKHCHCEECRAAHAARIASYRERHPDKRSPSGWHRLNRLRDTRPWEGTP